jgi:putative transposase
MSRGNGRQKIFRDRHDYTYFLSLLAKAKDRFRVECLGYCLMPTHYHAMLRPGAEPLSRMMQQLNGDYAQHFNRRYRHVGHVFQGRFKAPVVEGDTYLLTLLRYAMLNPVAAHLVKMPSAWRWSSYRATAGLCVVPPLLSLESVWAIFDATDVQRAQHKFVEFMALPEGSAPLIETLVYGSEKFVAALEPKLAPMRNEREYKYADRFASRPSLEKLLANRRSGTELTQTVRAAFLEHAYTLREIGAMVGRHPGTISRWIHHPPEPAPHRLAQILRNLEVQPPRRGLTRTSSRRCAITAAHANRDSMQPREA